MQKSHSSVTPKIVGAFAMSAVALVALYILVFRPLMEDSSDNTTRPEPTAQQPVLAESEKEPTDVPTQTIEEVATTAYADGNYTATVDYSVPKGETNRIVVELKITNDTVTSVTTTNSYEDDESSRYITGFENAIEASVKDKKLDEIALSRIGGASITTTAFMDALSDIAVKAKS